MFAAGSGGPIGPFSREKNFHWRLPLNKQVNTDGELSENSGEKDDQKKKEETSCAKLKSNLAWFQLV